MCPPACPAGERARVGVKPLSVISRQGQNRADLIKLQLKVLHLTGLGSIMDAHLLSGEKNKAFCLSCRVHFGFSSSHVFRVVQVHSLLESDCSVF